MMGKPASGSGRLFYTGFCLEERVPAGHELRLLAGALDFSFVRREVASLYGRNGHESLDPTVALKLMFLAFSYNVRSERELMRELPLRLDWLWFCGLDLDSPVPDHSVLTKARRRWGLPLFEAMFARVLKACDAAGLVGDRAAHADSTLLKASADKDGRVSRRLWEQLERGLEAPEMPAEDRDPPGPRRGGPEPLESPARSERAALNNRLVSPTDPDAATHTRQGVGTILGYRDHRLIDDRCGIITATHVTPADGDDGAQLPVLLGRMERVLDRLPAEVAGDSQYGTRANYDHCRSRRIRPYLKKRRNRDTPKVSWLELLPEGCTRGRALALMARRRTVAEGSFAEAHTRHSHRRCRWRRRWRVQIQACLVATAQNLKKLVRAGRRRAAAALAGLAARATLRLPNALTKFATPHHTPVAGV
jgi:transposase